MTCSPRLLLVSLFAPTAETGVIVYEGVNHLVEEGLDIALQSFLWASWGFSWAVWGDFVDEYDRVDLMSGEIYR